jgi:hypothetical protein
MILAKRLEGEESVWATWDQRQKQKIRKGELHTDGKSISWPLLPLFPLYIKDHGLVEKEESQGTWSTRPDPTSNESNHGIT